jgi:hypothetical protein
MRKHPEKKRKQRYKMEKKERQTAIVAKLAKKKLLSIRPNPITG